MTRDPPGEGRPRRRWLARARRRHRHPGSHCTRCLDSRAGNDGHECVEHDGKAERRDGVDAANEGRAHDTATEHAEYEQDLRPSQPKLSFTKECAHLGQSSW